MKIQNLISLLFISALLSACGPLVRVLPAVAKQLNTGGTTGGPGGGNQNLGNTNASNSSNGTNSTSGTSVTNRCRKMADIAQTDSAVTNQADVSQAAFAASSFQAAEVCRSEAVIETIPVEAEEATKVAVADSVELADPAKISTQAYSNE